MTTPAQRAIRFACPLLFMASCDAGSKPAPPAEVTGAATASATAAQATQSASAAKPPPSASLAPVASAPKAPASASWPAPDAPAPDEAEWATASAVTNAAPESMRVDTCTMKRVRSWFRFQCKELIRGSNMGTFNRDFFTKADASGYTLTVRARPGEIVSADVSGNPATFIHIGWASDDAEPAFAIMARSLQRDVWYIVGNEPKAIPTSIPEPSAQPREADFLKGVDVNSTDKVRRYPKCAMRIFKDWLLVSCETSFANLVGAGTPGKDFLMRHGTIQPSLIILPLRKGMDVESRMTPGGMFRVKWPEGSSAPTRIEAEKVE